MKNVTTVAQLLLVERSIDTIVFLTIIKLICSPLWILQDITRFMQHPAVEESLKLYFQLLYSIITYTIYIYINNDHQKFKVPKMEV